ncbi:heterokaryon incompatibility protein-domain-containing protein [Aspergillus caelatus]|uniref:Heterokaryon incompatibility protein-domain-containing protein n=1 Tax=Aspergillus caelatus TaxID=61420 RepID=A0A5N6ZVW5_9EURO|nr:heterokaryon incompatibility protein-domain-containing protein [Aspergillus caelatus]KAE8361751.1 heterokaryon incompatibility protein-domain-containing protein [Aspergillus caelatus]
MEHPARLDEEFLIEEWRCWKERGGGGRCLQLPGRIDEVFEPEERREVQITIQGFAGEAWREVAEEIMHKKSWEQLQQGERLLERLLRCVQESWDTHPDDEILDSFEPRPQFRKLKSSVPPIDRSDLLRTWLRSCDQNHPDCRADGSNHHPERVISVRQDDANRLQLHELECGVEYVALSYCWGNKSQEQKPYLTTDENFQRRKDEGFNYNDLPKLFQDAITVTRELGKTYLWIDALCIIQGNEEDWKSQGTKMEHIFASAYCTLAPSSAFEWKEGFLNTRRARNTGLPLCRTNPAKSFRRLVDEGPLNKRAWVLQERVLSRRTVFFTSSGIYWECGEGVRCDNFVKIECPLTRSYMIDSNFPRRLITSGILPTIKFLQELIENYTRRDITVITDRIAAFTGLITRLEKALETEGKYGVFSCALPRLLLWKRPDSKTEPIGYDHPIPSWSWMAYPGRIEFMTTLPLSVSKYLHLDNDVLRVKVHTFENCHIRPRNKSHGIYSGQKRVGLLFFDTARVEFLNYVIIGRRASRTDDDLYYILVVGKAKSVGRYQRLGVGEVQARCVTKQCNDAELI